jgi:hypothetical protein
LIHDYRTQAIAVNERSYSNALDAVAYDYIGQSEAFVKYSASDVGHAVWDRETCRAGVSKKRTKGTVANYSDWVAIGSARDDHRATRPGISGDGDRAVIGHKPELGLHHGGQRQEQ